MHKKKKKKKIWTHPTTLSAAQAFAKTKVCALGFSWILYKSLYNSAAAFRCNPMYWQKATQAPASSLTRYLACGGQMVDAWVLRRPVCRAKISLAKQFQMLLSQSIMQVSSLLQALSWMGQARHEALLCGVAPVGYGIVKQTALICLREPTPDHSDVATAELHRPWGESWCLVAAITDAQGCKQGQKSPLWWWLWPTRCSRVWRLRQHLVALA